MRNLARLIGAGLFLIFGATLLSLATSSPDITTTLTLNPSEAFAIDLLIPDLANPLGEAIRLSVGTPVLAALGPPSLDLTPQPVFWMMLVPFLVVSSHFFWQRWELL